MAALEASISSEAATSAVAKQAVHGGPARPMLSSGTQTSADGLRVPSRSPSTSGPVRQTPPPSSRKDVGVIRPGKKQGSAALAPRPAPPPKGRGMPSCPSGTQRNPLRPIKPAASKGQPSATTTNVPMDQAPAAPSFTLLPLHHPALQQSSASQGDPRGASPHSLPTLGPLLLLSVPQPLLPQSPLTNVVVMAAPEASISSAAAAWAVAKPARLRKYTADQLRERSNALQRARRQAARPPKVVKSPDTRRAERAAAQRARRWKANPLKPQKASISSVVATSGVAKHVQGDSDTQEGESTLTNNRPEPPDPTEVQTEDVSTGTAVQQSSTSQGGPRSAPLHSLPALRPRLLLSAPPNTVVPEASISSAVATSAVKQRGRPRRYTADEQRERKNAARRAKRQSARAKRQLAKLAIVKSAQWAKRAARAAAQRARRREARQKASLYGTPLHSLPKLQPLLLLSAPRNMAAPEASTSSEAATSALAKHVQGDSDIQEIKSILPNGGLGWGSSSDNSLTQAVTIKTDVQGDSDTQEIKSILPNSGPGWGSSSDNSLTQAVTIKTEPPEYVEQDKEPNSHLVSVKSEPECCKEVREPNSLVPTFTKDYTDMTKVTFHINAEPHISEETLRQHNTAVAVKIEPPDPTEIHGKAVSAGTAHATPSFALLPLPHPAVQQSSASQGSQHGAPPPLLPAPRNMTAPEAFISAAATISLVAKPRRGPPRQYTAEERKERRNAAKRAKRLAAKSTIVGQSPKTRCKSPNTRRAERTAAQRARRQNQAIQKREREGDRKAKLSKWEKASMSLMAATAAEAKHVQGDSDTQESESILPDDGPGWDSSSDNSLTQAVTIKTEAPEYVEQDKENSSHLVSPKSESQVSEETLQQHSAAVAVKIEPPDPTEVRTEAVSTGTGLDGSSGNTVMTAVTVKTEPPEFVEQDEEPSSHLVSVKSEPEWYEEVWEPGNPVPALTKGEPPDYTDVTKVTFHTNPEPQVSEGAQQRGNAAVAVETEPQDPMEVDAPAIHPKAGLGAAALKEFQQDPVPTNPSGSYAVTAQPLQWVPNSIRDEAQPQANVVYFHNVERHGIATQPVVATVPVVAVQPERPHVTPPWLAGLGQGAAFLLQIGQHRVLVDPSVAAKPS